MRKNVSRGLIGWILVVVCAGTILSRALDHTDAIPAQQTKAVILEGCTDRERGRPFARTELFFGKAKPDGSMVTDEEFRAFLDEVITPRFPNGLTMLSGAGQFRGSSGMIHVKEPCSSYCFTQPTNRTAARASEENSKRVQENLRPGIGAARRRQVLYLFLSASPKPRRSSDLENGIVYRNSQRERLVCIAGLLGERK